MNQKLFISYRRSETSGTTGRLYDHLAEHFGRDNVFMDVDNVLPGVDFVEALDRAVAECAALLVIIGDAWLTAVDEDGRARLKNPEDFVRLEVRSALARDILVLPVLVQGARMPSSAELPQALKPLARRQAVRLEHASFKTDVQTLIRTLEEHFRISESKIVPPIRATLVRRKNLVRVIRVELPDGEGLFEFKWNLVTLTVHGSTYHLKLNGLKLFEMIIYPDGKKDHPPRGEREFDFSVKAGGQKYHARFHWAGQRAYYDGESNTAFLPWITEFSLSVDGVVVYAEGPEHSS